ncbi:VOC family protein [Roseovarius sp. EL26]|uniref:VOC family protein n=1 Tax=Roseovarius sp. EL26 TaxID=2126672 RepID=UPI000EA06121|nr:VOC family protein [Roseovarius sp. EL26]
MKTAKCGIILNTENYSECVRFYRDSLGLPVSFEKEDPGGQLTCFEFTGAYLMVETGGDAVSGCKPITRCPTKLRFNVFDIEAAVAQLESTGVTVDVRFHSWGTTAEFCDPDGNRCALRSVTDFAT